MLTLLPLYVGRPGRAGRFPGRAGRADWLHPRGGQAERRRRDRLVAAVEALDAAVCGGDDQPAPRHVGPAVRSAAARGGADAADPQAVGAWVDAFACRPYPQRRSALGLEALGDFAGPDSGGAAPLASAGFFRALIGERSRRARLLLRQRLEHVVLSEELHGHDGPPLVAGAPEDEEAEGAWYDAQAGCWRTGG